MWERGAGRVWDALDLKTSPRNPDFHITVAECFVFSWEEENMSLSTGIQRHLYERLRFEAWQDEPNGNGAAAWHHHGKDGDQVTGTHFLHGSCFLKGNSGVVKRER